MSSNGFASKLYNSCNSFVNRVTELVTVDDVWKVSSLINDHNDHCSVIINCKDPVLELKRNKDYDKLLRACIQAAEENKLHVLAKRFGWTWGDLSCILECRFKQDLDT